MDFLSPSPVTGNYYDRNMAQEGRSGSGTLAGTESESNSYTVPAGKRAFVTLINVSYNRVTAATVDAGVTIYLDLYPTAVGTARLYLNTHFGNTVGFSKDVMLPISIYLEAGASVEAGIQNNSADGTIDWAIGLAVQEFNA